MISTLLLMSYLTFPVLSIGMGMVESGMNYAAVGDGGLSRGAFQVQGRLWGKVSKDPREQFRQHDAVLLELLTACGNLPEAVRRYNGSGWKSKRYLKRVTRQVLEHELLGGL